MIEATISDIDTENIVAITPNFVALLATSSSVAKMADAGSLCVSTEDEYCTGVVTDGTVMDRTDDTFEVFLSLSLLLSFSPPFPFRSFVSVVFIFSEPFEVLPLETFVFFCTFAPIVFKFTESFNVMPLEVLL